MIGRIAETLFWGGRYTERVDSHARLINTSFHTFQEWSGAKRERNAYWQNLLEVLGESADYRVRHAVWDEPQVLHFMTFDPENTNSIVCCLKNARNNIRSVQERIPKRLWETINAGFLWLKEQDPAIRLASPYMFYREMGDWMLLFHGIADSTMLHQDEWHFLRLGKYLERAENTLRLLTVEYNRLSQPDMAVPVVYQRLLSLFQTVDGFESFRKYYSEDITPDNAFAFLLLNRQFPRSIAFAYDALETDLQALAAEESQLKAFQKPIKMVQKVRLNLADLEKNLYSSGQLPGLMAGLLKQTNELSQEIGSAFFRERN